MYVVSKKASILKRGYTEPLRSFIHWNVEIEVK